MKVIDNLNKNNVGNIMGLNSDWVTSKRKW